MRRLLALLAIGALVSACTAASGGSPSGSGGATPTPSVPSTPKPTGSYAVPTGANDLVLRVEAGGGLVPPGYLLTSVPGFALYGDGRVIVPGPMIDIYPSPLLPNLRRLQLTAAEIQTIVAAADAAGLLGPDAHYDQSGIMDAPTTTFALTVAGRTHRVSAYALGIGADDRDPGATTARAKLEAFHDRLFDLPKLLGREVSDAAYESTSMRVFTSPAGSDEQPGITPQVVKWPLASDPARDGSPSRPGATVPRCFLLSGADLATFLGVARTANVLTHWTAPSGTFSVQVRPLYPEESGCPTAG